MAPSGAPGLLLLLVISPAILAQDNSSLYNDLGPGTGCLFDGERFGPGQAVPVHGEPCLRCRCRRGAPVCRLRVCAPLPDPPPRGCVLLHRANTCCPELHCPLAGTAAGPADRRRDQPPMSPTRYRADTPGRGCYLNGSLFAEGSALTSSSLCDFCYCVRGRQRCVRPQCVLPAPGCTPEYREHTCCPTSYHCGSEATGTSSTAAPTRVRPRPGCVVGGRRYREGAQVKSVARGSCEACFCMRGQVRCAPLKCDLPLDGCQPVTAPGKCCPESYDCSKSRVSITRTVSSASSSSLGAAALKSKVSSSRPAEWENSVRSFDARSNREISAKNISKPILATERADHFSPTTIMDITTDDSPTTLTAESSQDMSITLNTKLDLTGSEDQSTSRSKTRKAAPEKNKILPVIEAIINKTRQKDQDYDYDYNEPSLPPSLPNLRIIPFVAADAVVMQDKSSPESDQELPEASHGMNLQQPQDKIDSFFDFFSPPAETEGGFVPKHPVVDGPFYQANNEPPSGSAPEAPESISTKPENHEMTVRTVVPQAVTPDPLLGNTGSEPCVSAGRQYRHGELLSGMGACRMCFCFDGGVVCQEPSCGSVPPGCRRAPPRDADQCCGSITCTDTDRETPILFADIHHSPPERVDSTTPAQTVERVPVIEPIPDLIPVPTRPTAKRPSTTKPTTTTTTSTTTTTTRKPFTPAPTTEPTQTTAAQLTTPISRRPTPTRATTTPPRQSTLPSVRSTPKPTSKPKTTTPKSWTLKRTTPTPSGLKASVAAQMKNSSVASPPQTPPPTPPSTPPPTPPPTTTTTKILPEVTTKPTRITTAATTPTTSTITTPATTTSSSTTTTRTSVTTTSTRKTPNVIVTSTPVSSTTARTTTAGSFFSGLWGDEDESENEAQDKVDSDVEYQDFVSTNKHEVKPPVEDEDDAFSFDKLLELFINPDPPTTVLPVLSSTPVTTRTTPTTPAVPTTQRTTGNENRSPATSTTPRPTSTSKPPTTTLDNDGKKPETASTPSSPKTSLPSTTSKPKVPSTSPRPSSTTKKTVATTPLPRTSSAKITPPPPTTTTLKPTTKSKVHPTRRPATRNPPITTTIRFTTPTTPEPRWTTPSTTTISGVRNRNKTPTQHSSYPAQMHHLSTRRPPPAQGSTTTHRPAATLSDPAGISGLLKLAGCNIYGRMYRVGRIIQELSGPCLECRCTEEGVQCQQLAC